MPRRSIWLLASSALLASGCVAVNVNTASTNAGTATGQNRAPIISAFDYSPKTGIGKSDFITFTLAANDPEGQPLQYNWTNTKGMLSANAGQTVSWRPTKADGSFEPGLAQVTVTVSDGQTSTPATANLMIDETGHATLQELPQGLPSAVPSIMPAVPSPALVAPSTGVPPSATPVASTAPAVSATNVYQGVLYNGREYANGAAYSIGLPDNWQSIAGFNSYFGKVNDSKVANLGFDIVAPVSSLDSLTEERLKQILQPEGTWIDAPLSHKVGLTISGYPAIQMETGTHGDDGYFYYMYNLVQAPDGLYVLKFEFKTSSFFEEVANLSDYSDAEREAFHQQADAIARTFKLK